MRVLFLRLLGCFELLLVEVLVPVKFRDWCEDLIINSSKQTQEPIKEKLDIDGNIMKFYELYGILNPNAEFYIEHHGFKAKAYVDDNLGFIISTGELARIMGVKESTLRVLKKYHGDRLKEDKHFVKFGFCFQSPAIYSAVLAL